MAGAGRAAPPSGGCPRPRAGGAVQRRVPAPRAQCALAPTGAGREARGEASGGGRGGRTRTEQEGEEEVAKPSARARRLSPKARASPREGPVPLSSGQRAARYSEHGGEGGGGGDGGGGGGKKNRRGSEGARDKFRSHDCDPVRHKVLRAEFRPCANQQSDRRFP
ncbi:unnamed protein product [Prorocentrum cordatum]|uniref:Uncharacterized protein n=1 Tax=Prorocentrum cordatum TaxID=2364126 RepID=A0ABN9UUH5_9DINO|nr:unnamed protein product [Polarella glacialis]